MKPIDALQQYFSLDAFRPPQESIIEAILSGRDAMVIMPTGGGKSLCYQLPALLLPGVTLVISPLIALMKDQVDALRAKGIAAGLINSSLSWDEQRVQLDLVRQGMVKLLYVAPERFRAQSFLNALSDCEVSLFAVDEAHCLSQWGHDFRPDYMRLGQALEMAGRPTCAAFTATATPEVRDDILSCLNLRDPAVFVSGFARKNLAFKVTHIEKVPQKYTRVKALIKQHKTGIVYCATRKGVEEVSERLQGDCIKHVIYHGGMSDTERSQAQDRFMAKEYDVAVATNAFGMGIDRSDIRFVCHFQMPGSVEAYYQEGGRAGRDGKPSVCEMLFSYVDKRVQDFFIEGANPGKKLIVEVFEMLRDKANKEHEVSLTIDEIAESFEKKVNPMAVGTAITILGRQKLIERFDIPGQRARGTRILQPDIRLRDVQLDEAALAEKARRDESKLQSVIKFAYAKTCRQEWILRYFGETDSEPCGQCDRCEGRNPKEIRTLSEDEKILVQKALSGVARMSYKQTREVWTPRFGRNRIIQCLIGSHAEAITNAGLDKLSTWGIFKSEGKEFAGKLLNEMEESGLLEVTEGDYPLMGMTPLGARVMWGEADIKMNFPTEKVAQKRKSESECPADTTPAEGFDDELHGKLIAKRAQLAKVRRGVPLYTILNNESLRELATLQPLTPEEARGISGIGPAKMKKVVPTFIKIIREHKGLG